VDIRTAHGTDDENAASSALRAVLAAHDLRRSAAADELRQHAGYPWIYGQILADPDWFSAFLHRHGLQVPGQPRFPAAASAET
jgi:hypothetical protein